MSAHARLSPSAAERWMICPGSVKASESIVEERSSSFAAEGTAAHAVRADCLQFGFEPFDFLGRTLLEDGFAFTADEDMCRHLQPGIDWLREQPGRLVVEHRVDLGKWLPGQFGTLDAGICGEDLIDINDLKFGAGVQVDVVANKQLMIYGLGFWDNVARHETAATRFRFSIDQPRAGGLRTWECDLDELLAFGEEVAAAGRRTYEADAPFAASKKGCMWCPVHKQPPPYGALSGCKTYDTFITDLMCVGLDDLDEQILTGAPMVLPENLTPARRAHLVKNADLVSRFLARLHEDSLQAALSGTPDPGMKAVIGRSGHRKWVSEEQAQALLVAALRDDAFNRKLKSPSDAEKELKPRKGKLGHADTWASLSNLITQEPGKPILVEASDARPGLKPLTDLLDDLD